jgi:hypothetical protein
VGQDRGGSPLGGRGVVLARRGPLPSQFGRVGV